MQPRHARRAIAPLARHNAVARAVFHHQQRLQNARLPDAFRQRLQRLRIKGAARLIGIGIELADGNFRYASGQIGFGKQRIQAACQAMFGRHKGVSSFEGFRVQRAGLSPLRAITSRARAR